eukprot:365247-Chlamydomonas_euryale.AAC.2
MELVCMSDRTQGSRKGRGKIRSGLRTDQEGADTEVKQGQKKEGRRKGNTERVDKRPSLRPAACPRRHPVARPISTNSNACVVENWCYAGGAECPAQGRRPQRQKCSPLMQCGSLLKHVHKHTEQVSSL